jgi:hypothetical protein
MFKVTILRCATIGLATIGLATILCLTNVSTAQEELADKLPAQTDEGIAFYNEKIKPILAEHCAGCHVDDPGSLEGGIGLTGRISLLRGGHSGPAVDLKSPEKSLLLLAVKYEVIKMPPDEQLPQEQVEDIKRWIEMGIPWSPDEDVDHGPAEKATMVDDKAKNWWAFQPVERPEIPQSDQDKWSKGEIDRFLIAKLNEARLSPAPPADRRTLIRRATYDLIGLPPTPAEIEDFISDESPDAYEKLIERLLASSHYGEKWGRHWLDLVRYAESNSFERDGTKPFVWRYRDYVIRSFNEDKPYDQFLLEQLAGDELDQVTVDSMTATGYYRLGQWDDEPADILQAKFDELDDILATTSQTMLGLTVNCARCHDHKIDPISQHDYYSMLAHFGNIRRFGVRSPESVAEASITEMQSDAEQPVANSDDTRDQEIKELKIKLGEIEEKAKRSFEPVEHEEFQYEMHKLRLVEKQIGKEIERTEFDRYREMSKRLKELLFDQSGMLRILTVKEDGPSLPEMKIRIRGNPHVEGAPVLPGLPEVFGAKPEDFVEKEQTAGARFSLAQWIASRENPLTARVMVNRIWQYHFGEGIVRSSSDFGYQGTPPTHPELLNWLASEFVDSNWSIKQMHRKIMLSAAYQMSGQYNDAAYRTDPTNKLLWRFKLRRLTAEELRDSILLAAGRLNLADFYGPSVYPQMPNEVLQGQSIPGDNWPQSSPVDANRRSIYVHVKRSMQLPILASHDPADTDTTCPVRFVTTQPTQALTMINSQFTGEAAQEMARSVAVEFPDNTAKQIAAAFIRVTQRQHSEVELQQLTKLVNDWKEKDQLDQEQAMQQLCLLLLNLNEFVYVD